MRSLTEVCEEQDCVAEVVRWHRCQEHYQQLRRVGELIARLTDEERFWSSVNREGPLSPANPGLGPCWLWTGAPDTNGYGRVNISSRKGVPVHRYAYEQIVGTIPEGLELDHLCRVRACVRPEHLEPVTHEENMRRSWQVRRLNLQTHCKRGHSLEDEANVRWQGRARVCRKCTSRRGKEWRARKAREANTAA